ncbi:unnamed protein product, partial [Allacma fusca]
MLMQDIPEGYASLETRDDAMDEIDQILSSHMERQMFGEALSDSVALSYKSIPGIDMSKETSDRFKELYKVPENAKQFQVPKVNSHVWRVMSAKDRTTDGKSQIIQQMVAYALVAQSRVTDSIRQLAMAQKLSKEDVRSILAPVMDAAAALGQAHREISMHRRSQLRATLPALKPLCSRATPVTEYLFGDNLDA